jgi:cation transport ATPase
MARVRHVVIDKTGTTAKRPQGPSPAQHGFSEHDVLALAAALGAHQRASTVAGRAPRRKREIPCNGSKTSSRIPARVSGAVGGRAVLVNNDALLRDMGVDGERRPRRDAAEGQTILFVTSTSALRVLSAPPTRSATTLEAIRASGFGVADHRSPATTRRPSGRRVAARLD